MFLSPSIVTLKKKKTVLLASPLIILIKTNQIRIRWMLLWCTPTHRESLVLFTTKKRVRNKKHHSKCEIFSKRVGILVFFSRCKENTAISNCSSSEQVFPQLSGHLCQLLRLRPGRGGSKMCICWMWAEKSAAANSNNRRRWDEKYLKAHSHPAVTPLLPHSR